MNLGVWGAVFLACGGVPPDEKMTLETFRVALRECKSVDEKASVLRQFAATSIDEPGALQEIARFLSGTPSDHRFLLPLTSVSALSRLRGNKAACTSLIQGLGVYRKVPFMQRRMISALAAVGHESAVPVVEELIRGNDCEFAVFAVKCAEDLPADLALDTLVRSWEWMETRRPKVGDDVKNQYTRIGEEIYKVVQRLSEEKYPSMGEMQKWWSRNKGSWKEKAAEREKSRKAPPVEAPSILLIDLSFNEKSGLTAANRGVSSAWTAPTGALSRTRPLWSGENPPNGGGGSLDWGKEAAPAAVDLGGTGEYLRNLKSFTVTGWICCRSSAEGPGGNRILTWLDRDGVEIVYRSDGSLQVGVNQRAELSDARTPSSLFPLVDDLDHHSIANSWRFFAVTFDGTAESGQLRIYVGSKDQDAELKVVRDAPGRLVGPRVASGLSVGHLPPHLRPTQPACMFRGLMDDLKITGSTWDGTGALPPAALVRIQNRS